MSRNRNYPAHAGNAQGWAAWICLILAWLMFMMPIPGPGLLVGWPLNLAAFILAIIAMGKHGARAGVLQLIASLVVSPFMFFYGVGRFFNLIFSSGGGGAGVV